MSLARGPCRASRLVERADVIEPRAVNDFGPKVIENFLVIGGIAHDHDAFGPVPVRDDIVQNTAVGSTTTGVHGSPVGNPEQIVRDQPIDGVDGVRTRDCESPHV